MSRDQNKRLDELVAISRARPFTADEKAEFASLLKQDSPRQKQREAPTDTEALKALVAEASKYQAIIDAHHADAVDRAFAKERLQQVKLKIGNSWRFLERMLASQGAEGSSVCPICGKDSPHYHPPEVVTKHYDRARAITDQHILCVRLADALRGMPFPPHMPDEAGNAMRGALDEFDEKSAAYLQAALSAPPLAEPNAASDPGIVPGWVRHAFIELAAYVAQRHHAEGCPTLANPYERCICRWDDMATNIARWKAMLDAAPKVKP